VLGTRAVITPGGAGETNSGSAFQRVRDGYRYLASHRALRGLVTAQGLALVFFYFPIPIIVVYAKRSLHAGTAGFGAILTSWGIGIIIGSLVQARVARRAGPATIIASTGAVAAGYLGTAAAPSLAVACAVSVIGGIGNGTQWAAVETVVHRLVTEAFRARVTATLETLIALAPGFGILGGGALAAAWSPRAAYYIAGAGVCVIIAGSLLGRETLFGAARVAAVPAHDEAPLRLPAAAPQGEAGTEALAAHLDTAVGAEGSSSSRAGSPSGSAA
jgi:predicted MFS family arabinose efflux permease